MKYEDREKQLDHIRTWLGSGSINIFGMPFAGKDTHSQELAAHVDGTVLGGGEILRNSIIPQHVKALIDKGRLAPTKDYINIVLPYLSRKEFSGRPLILSSVGRWHGEEEGVLGAATASNHQVKAVIFLHIDQETAIERWEHSQEHLTRGEREDDAHHILDVRFDEFNNKTLPVVDYYRKLGLLIEIDGTAPVATVSQNIIDELYKFSRPHEKST